MAGQVTPQQTTSPGLCIFEVGAGESEASEVEVRGIPPFEHRERWGTHHLFFGRARFSGRHSLQFLEAEARERRLDRLGTTLQALSFRVGHLGLEHPIHAVAANDTWQGKRNSE